MTKTITVIATKALRSGTSNAGKAWTLWEVTATDVNGEPILEQLKSFAQLAPGPHEVEVEKQVHEQYGTSYLLKKVGGGGGGGGGGADRRLGELELRVANLEQALGHLRDSLTPPAAVPAAATAEPGAFGGDDDIPF